MIFIIFLILTTIEASYLTPLSECTKARITYYNEWAQGGACSFGPQSTEIVDGYMFGAAPNEYFLDGSNKCGICYEMVGPSGSVRFRIDNRCPVKGNEAMCSGDMIHFDMSANAYPYVQEYGGVPNVTVRMVACDYKGPLKVKSMKGSNEWWFALIVMEHTLGVKAVEVKDSVMTDFVKLERTSYNAWIITQDGKGLQFPLTARIYSIADSMVEITGITNEAEKMFEAKENFPIPNNKFFEIETLKMYDKPKDSEECCTLWDDYTEIYKDKLLGAYSAWKADYEYSDAETSNPFQGTKCVRAKFPKWGVLQYGLNYPARADQYSHLHFAVKGTVVCENCILIKTSKVPTEGVKLPVKEANKWSEYTLPLSDLNVTNQFWGFWVQNNVNEERTLYFDDIYLVKAKNAPDASVCWGGVSGNGGKNGNSSMNMMIMFILVLVLMM